MSPDESDVDSPGAFVTELGRLLEEAHRNDVDVEGGWTVPTAPSDVPDWDVEVWCFHGEHP